jgi:hypothetical protein
LKARQPDSPGRTLGVVCTFQFRRLRPWETTSNVLRCIANRQKATFLPGAGEFEAQLLGGTVGGPVSAAELIAFLRQVRQLPSIDEVLLNLDAAPLPAENSAQVAIATALSWAMTDNSVARELK